MRLELLTADISKLFAFLETVLQDGGKKLYSIDGIVQTFNNYEGYSGFEYQDEGINARLSLGMILGGTGYVIRRMLRNGETVTNNFIVILPEGERPNMKVRIVENFE